ncbi:MAG: hypothetical protein Q7K42_02975 [Candidatus Diapherotrites archaeon]|nr:hypothetical protein [Candidatus Diapherotrites archaeon]
MRPLRQPSRKPRQQKRFTRTITRVPTSAKKRRRKISAAIIKLQKERKVPILSVQFGDSMSTTAKARFLKGFGQWIGERHNENLVGYEMNADILLVDESTVKTGRFSTITIADKKAIRKDPNATLKEKVTEAIGILTYLNAGGIVRTFPQAQLFLIQYLYKVTGKKYKRVTKADLRREFGLNV